LRGDSILTGKWQRMAAPWLAGSLLFGVLVFAVASTVLIRSMQNLEGEAARQGGLRVVSAFALDSENLQRVTRTFAEWDESYKFIEKHTPRYLDVNFAAPYLDSLDVDYVWVLDQHGSVVGSATRLTSRGEQAQSVDPILTTALLIGLGDPVAARSAPLTERYLRIPTGLISVGVNTIRRSDLSGDVGTLVMAHEWSPRRLERLGAVTRRSLQLNLDDVTPDVHSPEQIDIAATSSQVMTVSAYLSGPGHKTVARVSMEWTRDLLAAGRRTTLLVICVLVAGFMGMVGLLAWRLRRSERAVGAQQRLLVSQARMDVLTGLPNRTALLDLAEQFDSTGVLYIDVDRFKWFNDSLGHHAGDDVLRAVAQRLRLAVRSQDVVVRLGGDEFLVVVPDVTTREALEQRALRIREQLQTPVTAGSTPVQVTLSVGCALCPGDSPDFMTAVKHADLALYHAKERGRNCHQIYEPEMGQRKQETDELRKSLAEAIRAQQLHVEYQPQYCVRTGDLTGFEALARWTHPEHAQIPPSRFIPIAEQAGLIDSLGEFVIREVCRQIREWRRLGGVLRPVSVNLSPKQFESGMLIETIRSAAREFGVEPQLLIFEITESVFMSQTDSHALALQQLRASGYRIAIDDFGTGYSSLSYLRLLPVSSIKIDRSFVRDLDGSEANGALVRSILDIARHFGLAVVAEGVETHSQLVRLRELKCDTAQGFFLHKPVSGRDCEQLLVPEDRREGSTVTQRLRVVS
jgi:diguanylate cyclase (GGDEF)-like protein